MKYKRYQELHKNTCEPVKMPILTQPNSALSLREILVRFSNGDTSVLSHIPVDDHIDKSSDEEFFKDDSFDVPFEPDDKIQGQELLRQMKEDVKLLKTNKDDDEKSPDDTSNDEENKEEENIEKKGGENEHSDN